MDLREQHNGVPQRPPASAHFLVASTDRYPDYFSRFTDPNTSASWNMNKNNNLLSGYFTRLAITQINFFWNIPTIVEGKNDFFAIYFFDEEVTISCFIPPGFYTPAELATAIEDGVTGDDDYDPAWNFQVTFVNNHFEFSSTTDIVINPAPSVQDFPEATAQNRLLITLGYIVTEPSLTLRSGIPTMLYTRFLDICSNKLTTYQRVKDGATLPFNLTSDQIARVYATPPNVWLNTAQTNNITFSQPWTMTIDYNTPKHIKWDINQAINNFDINIYDEYGDLMYWSEDFPTEYNFTFLASET